MTCIIRYLLCSLLDLENFNIFLSEERCSFSKNSCHLGRLKLNSCSLKRDTLLLTLPALYRTISLLVYVTQSPVTTFEITNHNLIKKRHAIFFFICYYNYMALI